MPRGDTPKVAIEKRTFSVEEAAEFLGISRAGAYIAIRRGEIPHIRIGRSILIPRHALEQLLETATLKAK